jgi:hypothetical protein
MAKKSNGVTRKEAVRQALGTLGKDASRSDIQKFIKDKYSFEMNLDHISTCKGEIQKEQGHKKTVAQKAEPKPLASAPPDSGISLKDIEAVKDLVERVGVASLKQLIDVMAR